MMKPAQLLLIVACASLFPACGDVDSCKERVTPGCLNSAPRPDGSCLFDLVPRAGICVKPGGVADLCALCPEGSLCVPEVGCVNFCEQPPILPGSVEPPDPIFCRATASPDQPSENPMLSFDEVCRRRCRLRCRRQEQFCPGYQCPDGACDQAEVQSECSTDCPLTGAGAQDLACLTQSCEDALYQLCSSSMQCPNGAMPNCADITCTNNCMYEGQGLTADGTCDDGDPASAYTSFCEWGSDCADCGPRQGTGPEPGYWGTICAFQSNCAGATGRPSDSQAWCLEQESVPGVNRCMPDCSRGQGCPDGFECHEATFDPEMTGTAQPIMEGNLKSQACVPLLCM